MSEFGFEELRTIHRKERNVTSLVEIPASFYSDLSSYINQLYDEAKGSQDLGKLRLLENTVKVARDIGQRRMQKILTKALKAVRTGSDDPKNMTEEEKEYYHALIDVIRRFDSFIENVASGEYELVESSVNESSSSSEGTASSPQESEESSGESAGESVEKSVEGVSVSDDGSGSAREMLINETSQNLVLARVIKSIPSFVAPDGNDYGPYDPEEIIRLPEDVANILVDQGLVEIL